MNTYLIMYQADGDCYDLVVRAENVVQAKKDWRQYYTLRMFDLEEAEPNMVYQINDLSRHVGSVRWGSALLPIVGGRFQ